MCLGLRIGRVLSCSSLQFYVSFLVLKAQNVVGFTYCFLACLRYHLCPNQPKLKNEIGLRCSRTQHNDRDDVRTRGIWVSSVAGKIK